MLLNMTDRRKVYCRCPLTRGSLAPGPSRWLEYQQQAMPPSQRDQSGQSVCGMTCRLVEERPIGADLRE